MADPSMGERLRRRRDASTLQIRLCETLALTRAQLVAEGRVSQSVSDARAVGMYIARNTLKMSFPEIGEAFARDHTSVMAACRKITAALPADPDLRKVLQLLGADLEDVVVALSISDADAVEATLDLRSPDLAERFRRGRR